MESFRPGVLAPMVERWSRLPIDHNLVKSYPEFFRGLVELPKGVNNGDPEPGQ